MNDDELRSNKTDYLVASAKAVLGSVPGVGAALSEIVTNIVPNQRIDRIHKYLTILEKRLLDIEKSRIQSLLKNDECVELFEESFIQAGRAITDERREYIASIVRNGLDNESIQFTESTYLLRLLHELNEQEIIWLRYSVKKDGDKEFFNKHQNILNFIKVDRHSNYTTLEKAALQRSYKEHLDRLGLTTIKRNDADTTAYRPQYLLTREIKPQITILGKLLLKQIGLLEIN